MNPFDPIYISTNLLMKIRCKNYNIRAVVALSDESYYLHYLKFFGNMRTSSSRDDMRDNLDEPNAKFINSGIVILELRHFENDVLVGFLSYLRDEIQSTLTVNYLGISKENQRKGLGTLLMDCAISIAQQLKLSKITLEAEIKEEKFYVKKIGMSKIKTFSYGLTLMVLDLSPKPIKDANPNFTPFHFPSGNHSSLKYLDLALSDKQHRTPIPLKQLF